MLTVLQVEVQGLHSGVIGGFHGRRFGPLVDGSDRADFFPDAGDYHTFPV